MERFWSHDDWPNYSSSSSNLSAFAPPFTVNKSTSNDLSAPFVDLAESADASTLNHSAYGYDSFSNPLRELDSTPFSKPYCYGYPGFQFIDQSNTQLPQLSSLDLASEDAFAYDNCRDSIKLSVVESQPYYPPNVSSPTRDGISSSGFPPLDWSSLNHYATKSCEIEYLAQRPGSWNQSGEFNQGESKQVEVGKNFGSKETNINGMIFKEDFTNQGCQDVKGSNKGEVFHSANLMNWEKHSVPISVHKLDDKSCWWQTSKSMPVDFSSTSVQGTPLMSQETHCEPRLKSVADSGNHHLFHTDLRQHDKPPEVDTGSSAPITVVVKNLNVGDVTTDGALDSYNFSNIKEASPMPISESTVCSDLGQFYMHLGFEPTSSNIAMLSNWNVSRDVVDYVLEARPTKQNPHANPDNLSLRHSVNGGVNSVEKFLDSVDQCNPAVDSPCWKGAPASHFSLFEASEALHPEFMKKSDDCFGSNLQGPKSFLLDTENNEKMSCEISNKNQMRTEIDCQEKALAGSPTKFSVSNIASEEYTSDGAVNAGPFQSKPNCDCTVPYLDDISENGKNSVPPNKLIYDCKSRPSNAEQQVMEENKFTSQKQNSLFCCTDVGFNVNECLECSTSQAAEHGLYSPSFIVGAPTELKTTAKKVPTPKIDIQILVKMMHNMSELLLGHCLTDEYELNDQDRSVLENVISNLCTCALKNAEQMIPAQKRLFPRSDSGKLAGESPEFQQNASIERPHLTKLGPERAKVELENLPVMDMKDRYFVFSKEHGKISDSSRTRGDDIEMKKADKMTKAIKRILSENFHDEEGLESQTLLYKNLWLEAEAALCSINYRARYNQMMIEMEKYSCKQIDNNLDEREQSKPEADPKLSPSQRTATEVNSFHSARDMSVLNAANLMELSGMKFSPDLNKPITSQPEGKGSQNVDSFIQDSTVFGTNKEAEDYKASVLARFHVLKSRDDRSCINTAKSEDLSNSKDSPALDTAPTLAPGGTDSPKTQNKDRFTQDSPIPVKEQASDLEASVMARFHILKSSVEDSNSMSSEGQLLDGVGFAENGTDASESESLMVNINPEMHLSSYTAVNESILKEFHIDLEDDREIQPRATHGFGNQLRTDYSDGLSSDWEHVKKEDLAGADFEILRAGINDWMNTYGLDIP